MTNAQANELRAPALAANAYEKSIYKIPAPQSPEGLIEVKMQKRKLKRKESAQLMGIGEPGPSAIMNKQRPVDVSFLKAVHGKLGIAGNLLLQDV